MLPSFALINGSCASKKDGLLAVLESKGDGVIMVTDPPYTDTKYTASASKRVFKSGGQAISRPISYGKLMPAVRKAIARAVTVVEWSAIWDRPEGMYLWKKEIEKAGGVWCGTGIVKQVMGAPRLRGDGPGIRTLGLAIARRRGRCKWEGRPWAEYAEKRMPTQRPITGTRSIDVAREVISDLWKSCANGCGLVVDPCAGTGMILQAARLEGLESIGWEIDPGTHAYAQQLLEGKGEESEAQPCLW